MQNIVFGCQRRQLLIASAALCNYKWSWIEAALYFQEQYCSLQIEWWSRHCCALFDIEKQRETKIQSDSQSYLRQLRVNRNDKDESQTHKYPTIHHRNQNSMLVWIGSVTEKLVHRFHRWSWPAHLLNSFWCWLWIHLATNQSAIPIIVQMHINVSFSNLAVIEPSVTPSQRAAHSWCKPAPTFCTIMDETMYLKFGETSSLSFTSKFEPIESIHSEVFAAE